MGSSLFSLLHVADLPKADLLMVWLSCLVRFQKVNLLFQVLWATETENGETSMPGGFLRARYLCGCSPFPILPSLSLSEREGMPQLHGIMALPLISSASLRPSPKNTRNKGLHLLQNMFDVPLLVFKVLHHYWRDVFIFSWGLEMEGLHCIPLLWSHPGRFAGGWRFPEARGA